MKKTKELIQENLKLVDIVLELVDARIPMSSKNPDIDKIVANKPRIIVLNKSDLANPEKTGEWVEFFKKTGCIAVPINALNGEGIDRLVLQIKSLSKSKMDKLAEKGMRARPVRVMMVGVPNVGKSSLINRLAKRKSAKIGDKPGVTKSKQWVRLKGNLELLDMPGVLWPKFEDPEIGLKLAFTGCIKDEVLNMEELALALLEYLSDKYAANLMKRYQLDSVEENSTQNLEKIARKRGCIFPGNKVDYERAAKLILDEFREGKIGKITLETPGDFEKR